ncbi:hypothetical protein SBADM41S_09092 [Streptomyces badius]
MTIPAYTFSDEDSAVDQEHDAGQDRRSAYERPAEPHVTVRLDVRGAASWPDGVGSPRVDRELPGGCRDRGWTVSIGSGSERGVTGDADRVGASSRQITPAHTSSIGPRR